MKINLFDGAIGTMLQKSGLKPGYCPELWNYEEPEKVTQIHREYVLAGADIIETNTFGANRLKLSHYGLEDKVTFLNNAAVKAARDACNSNTKIAGSIGPTGKLIAPLGDLPFDQAYQAFYEQITALDGAGVDFIIIETIIDIQEMRAALLAAKAATLKPVICQLTFGEDCRTITGTDAITAAVTLEALGADIIGANCSLGPDLLLPVVKTLSQTVNLPISVQPNAGMPCLVDGQTVFPMDAGDFGKWAPKLIEAGASYIGGCCGTTPLHIEAMRETIDKLKPSLSRNARQTTALSSRSRTVFLGAGFRPVIIGERINPTGRRLMAEDLKKGNFDLVKKEALSQIEAGAGILDVNMGVPGVDQADLMEKAIAQLSMLVDAPLAIDTTDPVALEAGLRAYPGRALINSVSLEKERLDAFLPLAKKYGAAVLCLPLNDEGVPNSAEERLEIAERIIAAGVEAGLRPHDFFLDPLVMAIASEPLAAAETLNTLKLYHQRFGYPTVMGLSNVSFGLPRRDLLNASFCAMALDAGLNAPILNPFDRLMMDVWAAAEALGGYDSRGLDYSGKHLSSSDSGLKEQNNISDNLLDQIKLAVITGQTTGVTPLVKKAAQEGYQPLEITEQSLTSAMNKIGEDFASGRSFLPQVMMAAETMRIAFETIKEMFPFHSQKSAGKILLATVKGDVHDLGKNIVAALLENSAFTVVDLGKDVPPEKIVATALENNPDIVGLCALMTTTLPQIEVAIKALKDAGCPARIIIGGAVVTEEYASSTGADAYAADGVAALNIAKEMTEEK